MNSSIFRKKSIDRVSSPEQLDDYIRVSNPGIWLVLLACIFLLAGVCVWGVFGRLDTTVEGKAVVEEGTMTIYVQEDEEGQWVMEGEPTQTDLADGVYEVDVVTESIAPISFLID